MKLIRLEDTKKIIAEMIQKNIKPRMRSYFTYYISQPTYVLEYNTGIHPFLIWIYYLLDPEKISIKNDGKRLSIHHATFGEMLWLTDPWYTAHIKTIDDYIKYIVFYMQFYIYGKKNTFFIIKDAFDKATKSIEFIDYEAFRDALKEAVLADCTCSNRANEVVAIAEKYLIDLIDVEYKSYCDILDKEIPDTIFYPIISPRQLRAVLRKIVKNLERN